MDGKTWEEIGKKIVTPKERKTVTVEQLALSNAYQLEAMINVLEQKGILTPKEIWPNWN